MTKPKKSTEPTPESLAEMPQLNEPRFRRRSGRGAPKAKNALAARNYIDRVREALVLQDNDEMTKREYLEALIEIRGDIDGHIEAAEEELR